MRHDLGQKAIPTFTVRMHHFLILTSQHSSPSHLEKGDIPHLIYVSYSMHLTRVVTLNVHSVAVCAYTLLRRVLIHADCKWPFPTPSATLPLYEMITCFI